MRHQSRRPSDVIRQPDAATVMEVQQLAEVGLTHGNLGYCLYEQRDVELTNRETRGLRGAVWGQSRRSACARAATAV
jgi:hypothetical protein